MQSTVIARLQRLHFVPTAIGCSLARIPLSRDLRLGTGPLTRKARSQIKIPQTLPSIAAYKLDTLQFDTEGFVEFRERARVRARARPCSA